MGKAKQAEKMLIRLRSGEAVGVGAYNPYVQKALDLEGMLYSSAELKKQFPRIFRCPDRPLWAEVGCYLGETLVEMAMENPRVNFIGVDVRFKRVVKACRRIQSSGLENARIALCDGGSFLFSLPENSLDGMNVFFPDPWLRPKQRKHRFVNVDFVSTAFKKLKPGGVFWLKTDQSHFFSSTMDMALETGFVQQNGWQAVLKERDYDSFFQRLFKQENKKVSQALLVKPLV